MFTSRQVAVLAPVHRQNAIPGLQAGKLGGRFLDHVLHHRSDTGSAETDIDQPENDEGQQEVGARNPRATMADRCQSGLQAKEVLRSASGTVAGSTREVSSMPCILT